MKVIISVQSKGASSRGLVHYIAHSKTDAEKEAKTREIFSEYADDLTVEKANDFLKTGTKKTRPANEELHHLVISLRAEDYDRLGADEKEKQQSLKKITKHALEKLKEQVGADKLVWAAGIHLNTNNPHVHIAVQKTYFDKNLEKKFLGKIPAELLPHYKKNGEEKIFTPGILLEAANEKLDEILLEKEKIQKELKQNFQTKTEQNHSTEKIQENISNKAEKIEPDDKQVNTEIERERDILARAILAKFYLEKTRENLDLLENHGDKRRFKMYDEITKKNRKISLFDLERRAEKTANRQIKNLQITDAVKKDELRKTLVEAEMQKNMDGIKRIKTILSNLIVKENETLRERENNYNQIKPLATQIRQNCRRENRKLPIPNLKTEDLEMLQAGSIEKKDIRAANYFERVRIELARERNEPSRTNDEIARLKANRTLSELKVLSFEKQLKDLNDRKRAFPVEIDGRKWSVAKADSFIEKQRQDEQKIVGKISKVLGKIGLTKQPNNLAKFEEIKTAITEKLNEKSEQFSSDLKSENSLFKTLDEFYKNETHPEKENIKADFSAAELAEIEALAFDLKLADIYRENWHGQKQFIENANAVNKKSAESINKTKQHTIAGRAIAREVMCEIELSRAKEELSLFRKHKNFQKFEIENKKTGETKFVSLKEVELNQRGSILDQTLEYFTENREKRRARNEIEKRVKEKNIELKENLKSAKLFSKIAAEDTRDYKTKSFFGAAGYTHAPLFTPKELITIELRIKQTESKSEAGKLQKILDSADYEKSENLSAILAGFSAEKEFSKPERNLAERKRQKKENIGESKESLNKTNKGEIGAKIIKPEQNLKINAENQTKGR